MSLFISRKEQSDSETERKSRSKRERLVWIGVTTVLITLLVILAIAPRVSAQSRDQDARYYLKLFNDVFQFIENHYVDEEKTNPHALIEGAFKGLFEALDDPHSAYLTAEEMRRLRDDTQGEFGGVGIYILTTDKGVEVARPIEGTPAQRAGIRAGDVITAVEGQSIAKLSIDDVVKLLRGKPGSSVTVTILRGESYSFNVTLARDMIEIPTVRSAIIPKNIGYLQVLKFTPMTADRIKDSLESLRREGFKSLIIDLRGNPGGLLSSVVDVADLFFDEGAVIVSTRSRIPADNRIYRSGEKPVVSTDMTIIVLIDRYSASASEILTGALKDSKRALILGETSYGKGSVQQIIPVDTGGFRLTTSKYYTPLGISIDKVGITPDITVKRDDFTEEEIQSYRKLLEGGFIREFLSKNPNPSDEQVISFVVNLQKQGIVLREERIKKEIRDVLNQINSIQSMYDLEYDIVLKEAVRLLREGKVE